MSGLFQIKSIVLGVLLVSPAFAAWGFLRSGQPVLAESPQQLPIVRSSEGVIKIPIEIIEKGSASRKIYVESTIQAVPEPSIVSLFAAAGLIFILRRQR